MYDELGDRVIRMFEVWRYEIFEEGVSKDAKDDLLVCPLVASGAYASVNYTNN